MLTIEQFKSQTNPFMYRFYNDAPEAYPLETCNFFGKTHFGLLFEIQIDPRWSDEQIQAYLDGYQGESK